MNHSVSFGNVSSGAFFSDDFSIDNQSIVNNISYGFDVKKAYSSASTGQTSDQTDSKIDLKWTILRLGISLVISECIDKLEILRLIMREKVDPKWYEDIHYRPPHKRFHDDAQQMDEEDYNLLEYTNRRKMCKDICLVYNILRKGLIEFETRNTSDSFHKAVNILQQEFYDVTDFRFQFEDNRMLLASVLQDFKDAQLREKERYEDKMSELYKSEQKYEDLVLFSKFKMRYLNRWEDNRCYLNVVTNDEKEEELSNLIAEYKQKTELEARCHDELCTFMKYTMIDMQAQIEYWMEQYDEVLERKDSDIYTMRVRREKVSSDFSELKIEYDVRAQEIILWLEYKEKLHKRMELEENMRKAATKIQAWWKGTMVRRKLGRYGKRKKGKKGKNKNAQNKLKKKQ